MINHISFDFWDTLYIGDPNFRIARGSYIHSVYGFSSEQVHTAVTKTKNFCDVVSEKTMANVDTLTQCWHLLDNLGCASIQGAIDLANRTHEIFLENPPIPVFTLNELRDLKLKGVSISISCNTGLISGDSIVSMLKTSEVFDIFDYVLFSDHIGYFKPNPFFLKTVLDQPKCRARSFEEILHIGDNPNTDGLLCQFTNTNFLQVEKGNINFKDIHNYL